MSNPKQYKLDSISDLLAIPIDRLDDCINDLKLAIESAHFVGGEGAEPEWFGEFVWTDDGDTRTDVDMGEMGSISFACTDDGGDGAEPAAGG